MQPKAIPWTHHCNRDHCLAKKLHTGRRRRLFKVSSESIITVKLYSMYNINNNTAEIEQSFPVVFATVAISNLSMQGTAITCIQTTKSLCHESFGILV